MGGLSVRVRGHAVQGEGEFVYDPTKLSELEASFLAQIEQSNLPRPEFNLRVHNKRRWLFDFAWPALWLAVEIEGGTWIGGRHVTGEGYERDCRKYNAAALLGWTVLRFTGGQVENGEALVIMTAMLSGDGYVRELAAVGDRGTRVSPRAERVALD